MDTFNRNANIFYVLVGSAFLYASGGNFHSLLFWIGVICWGATLNNA
jgi:hypothetical protein